MAADALKSQPGKSADAKKLYVACAEALSKIKQETTDDENFQKALNANIAKILDNAESCTEGFKRQNTVSIKPGVNPVPSN